jgi:hypothetical protein
MTIRAGIMIDLGNSETRIEIVTEETVKNNEEIIKTFPNRFAPMPPNYKVPNQYKDKDITVVETGGIYYTSGQLAMSEFSDEIFRPTGMKSKSTQVESLVSLNLAILYTLEEISDMMKKTIEELDVVFDLFLYITST